MGIRDRLMRALGGDEPLAKEGTVVEAASVDLWRSELIVIELKDHEIPARAVPTSPYPALTIKPMARIMVRSEHLAEARRLIDAIIT